MRYIIGVCALVAIVCTGLFVLKKPDAASTKKNIPLYLQHQTFLDGVGLTRLGKKFLLRYKQDRVLFVSAKDKVRKQRRLWREGPKETIPSTIHSLWLSNDPVPEAIEQARSSVRLQHPKCTFVLWDEAMVLSLMSEREKEIWKSIPKVLRQDVGAALVLYHKGGVVVDPAVQCLSPFYSIFSSGDWICSFEPPLPHTVNKKHLWLSTVFLAATPRHELSREWLDKIFFYFQVPHKIPVAKQYLDGIVTPLHQVFVSDLSNNNHVLALPATCFVPLSSRYIGPYLQRLFGEDKDEKKAEGVFVFRVRPPFSKVARESFGIHMYGGRIGELFSKDKKQKDRV